MAIAADNLTTLNGLLKETYADKVHHMIPLDVTLQNLVKFISRDKQPGNF